VVSHPYQFQEEQALAKRGFTLIELLVVIVIIGILVAIALPNFIKIKDKAFEAEVKQNLHSIQLAVERYQVDTGDTYPYFLYGGDSAVNMGTVWGVFGEYSYMTADNLDKHPFDLFWLSGVNTWHYQSTTWDDLMNGTASSPFGDSLQYEGYMPKYPRNPFQSGQGKRQYDTSLMIYAQDYFSGWGGRDGSLMFNLNPWGQGPYYNPYYVQPVDLEFPGSFFYHPRWQDSATHWGHLYQQYTALQNNGDSFALPGRYSSAYKPPLNDALPDGNSTTGDVFSLEVSGYDLTAVGSIRTKGQDLDNSIKPDGTNAEGRTGYLTLGQEKNPWVQAGDYPNSNDYDERPYSDSVQDYIIIHLGSGMDKKISDPVANQ
jgi:prepilin-type N-terminal cleavage/methylation domain-containing protein